MNRLVRWYSSFLQTFRFSFARLIATALVVAGLILGATVHKGFMILMAIGVLGPGVLRQFGLLNDLDEFQKEAAAQAGLRAYLVGGIFLMVVVVMGGWNNLAFRGDQVPASVVMAMMMVVYYASYCLSFWDARKAVSNLLLVFGVFWLVFVILSHGNEPMALIAEGLLVPGPFILGAILCRWWPRIVGVILLSVSIAFLFFFHILPLSDMDSQRAFKNIFMLVLVPLPFAVAGIALIMSKRENGDRSPADTISEQ